MKKIIFILSILISFNTSYGQDWETVGAGVIDFLLTNPKTASKTNASQAAALNVIGDILNQTSQRKHELNVATAGRNEIVINADNGNQATIYSDNQGNVYLLNNGTIYPISQTLVNQAKKEYVKPSNIGMVSTIENATLYPYDLTELKNEYSFAKKTPYNETKEWRRYYLSSNKETLSQIASRNNVSVDDIYFKPYLNTKKQRVISSFKYNVKDLYAAAGNLPNSVRKKLERIYSSSAKLTKTPEGCYNMGIGFRLPGTKRVSNGYQIYIQQIDKIPVSSYDFKIVTSFTCNWARDFDGNGYDFNDFQGIKRSFSKDENILFILGYTSESSVNWDFEIFEAYTGKSMYKRSSSNVKGAQILTIEKQGEKLFPGTYIYNFSLSSNNNNTSTSEKFEIIDNE
jgi:hypothetical protein